MKRKNKFTLLELLIVIGIIAVLAAILLPALSKAKDRAHVVYCANNLKQQGTAFQQYALDFDGWLMAGGYADYGYFWWRYPQVLGYLGQAKNKNDVEQQFKGIFVCPSHEKAVPLNNVFSVSDYISYAINHNIATTYYLHNPGTQNGDEFKRYHYRMVDLQKTVKKISGAVLVVEGDGSEAGSAVMPHTKTSNSPYAFTGPQYGIVLRHSRATNTLYADGHVNLERGPLGMLGQHSNFLDVHVAETR